jgi:hypothetical protein
VGKCKVHYIEVVFDEEYDDDDRELDNTVVSHHTSMIQSRCHCRITRRE